MREDFETSHNFLKKLKEEYNTIYHGLSTKFDRYPGDNHVKPNEIISQIIADFYNIPDNVVLEDLKFEQDRQSRNKIEIPEIPTYKIRFAIEEGTWIVLFRDFFRSSIREEFNRLITLEELIWETDGYTTDDLGYYVLELLQIGERWIFPIFDFWKKNHDYAKIEDFAVIQIATYHQTSVERGKILYEGGKRLFNSKVEKLSKLSELKNSSTWFGRADELIQLVKNKERSSNEEIHYQILIITLALLQKEIITHNHNKMSEQELGDENGTINWQDLDPTNPNHVEEYSESIIEKLYLQEEEDPFIAGANLLQTELEKNDIANTHIQKILEEYQGSIKKIESDEIFKLQEIIPRFLLKMKKLEIENKLTVSNADKIKSLPVWDSLHDTLTRVNRIDDKEIAQESLFKAIKSVYSILLNLKLTPIEAIDTVLQNYRKQLELDEERIDEIKNIIRIKYEEMGENPIDKNEVDTQLVMLLAENLLNESKNKK